ncbi:MAG: hypothetical protein H5T64_04255 [Chloroflexi bacterium]|nr:hypothetical protein [Chloroflexota bacterium]
MEILAWVDQLEALLNEGWRVPLTNKTVIDEERFLYAIDQLRVSIPKQVREAEKILQEKEAVIAQGRAEAEHIIAEARNEVAKLVNDNEISAAARKEAEEILAKARQEAEEMRRGADEYAYEVLSQIEEQLSTLHQTILNGLRILERRQAESGKPPEAAEGERLPEEV